MMMWYMIGRGSAEKSLNYRMSPSVLKGRFSNALHSERRDMDLGFAPTPEDSLEEVSYDEESIGYSVSFADL